MSYENLEEARKKRAEEDAAKAKRKEKRSQKREITASEAEEAITGKGNHCRKRKSAASETDAIGPNVKVVRTSETLEPVSTPVSSVQAVPVARMY